jgi:hypothetical protein
MLRRKLLKKSEIPHNNTNAEAQPAKETMMENAPWYIAGVKPSC